MSIIHFALATAYHPINFKNTVLRKIGVKTRNSLRVLHYHDILPNEFSLFTDQIKWLAKTWNFIKPEHFADIMRGERDIEGRMLMLTFDDGFASNRRIAEQILNPMGINALFFVVADFIKIADMDESQSFISKYINPNMNQENIDQSCYNMNKDDLSFLINTGHTIGSHTLKHTRLSKISSIKQLEKEIVCSADILEETLGIKINHFAFPFGNINSFSSEALEVAHKRFPFIYTGLRGDNAKQKLSWAIRRDAMHPKFSLNLVGAFLEGCADLRYSKSLSEYEHWVK